MARKKYLKEEASDEEPSVPFQLGPDSQLLTALLKNGRAPYEELGAQLGTSRQTVWRRIQNLLGSTIWGFSAIIDHQRLGWRQYLISIPGSPDYKTIHLVEEAAAEITRTGRLRVLHSALVRGDQWRFAMRLAAKDSLTLETFLQALRDRFPGQQDQWAVEEVEYILNENGVPNPERGPLQETHRREAP